MSFEDMFYTRPFSLMIFLVAALIAIGLHAIWAPLMGIPLVVLLWLAIYYPFIKPRFQKKQ